MNTSWKEVKKYLKDRIDSEPISPSEIIGKSGLSRDSYYRIFASGRENSPMRRSTVYGLAVALNLSVEYANKYPQFSDLNISTYNNVPIHFAREALQVAVDDVGDTNRLADLIGVTASLLDEILSPSAVKQIQVSRTLFVRIGSAIGRRLLIDPSGKLEYLPKDESITNAENEVSYLPHSTKHLPYDFNVLADIVDSGLRELFEPRNIKKHGITDGERFELSLISWRRKSNTSMDHWVSILYTLRSLN